MTKHMKQTSIMVVAIILLLGVAAIPTYAQINNADNCVNTVTVWDNDTITRIANRQGVNAAELANANGLTLGASLRIGDVLCLDGLVEAQPAATSSPAPTETQTTTPAATATATATDANVGTGGSTAPEATETATDDGISTLNFRRGQNAIPNRAIVHTVAAGETLFGIAQSYNVVMNEVLFFNAIPEPYIIFTGESLIIPPQANGEPSIANTATPQPTDTESTTTATATPDATSTPSAGNIPAGEFTGVHQPAEGTIPTVGLNPVRATVGDTVTVNGANYPGNAEVTLYIEKQSQGLRSTALGTTTTNPDGTFSTTIVIPDTWENGAPVDQTTVSISAYATVSGYWGMNYFVNAE